MTAIGIFGSKGRMGQAIAAAIAETDGLSFSGGVDAGDGGTDLVQAADVLIDFSAPAALEEHLELAVTAKKPIVIGTTGLEERHHWLIDQASEEIAVLQTGNTSLGVTLLAALVREAAARLGPDWDIEIVESHHRMKVDAPSGTALLLGDAAAAGRGTTLADAKVSGRDGITGARDDGAIGFAALRGGTIAGDHSVMFLSEHERLTLSHLAENRSIFARGALKAATWLRGQKPGRYSMNDVLNLI